MSHPRFYVEQLGTGRIVLAGHEWRHARLSKRLSVGDDVALFDGRGQEAYGVIETTESRQIRVQVRRLVSRSRPQPRLTLAVALPKGPRQDILVEKSTELGVECLWSLVTERSVSSASAHKLERWKRAAIEAAKQSGQCWLPEFRGPADLREIVAQATRYDQLWVAVEPGAVMDEVSGGAIARAGGLRRTMPLEKIDRLASILGLIGPEGGWTPPELSLLVEAGVRPVSLGLNVLRIETAAIALASIIHAVARRPLGGADGL